MIRPNIFIKDRISDGIFFCRMLVRPVRPFKTAGRILMYHSIDSHDPEKDSMGLGVSPSVFQMHLEYLKENGFRVIGLLELARAIKDGLPIPDRSVAITFDDGYRSILTGALPVLKKFCFASTLFVNVDFIEKKLPEHLYWHDWPTLNWDEVGKLSGNGISIGAHGITHRRLSGLSRSEVSTEVLGSKKTIESHIGKTVGEFSYPQGAFDKETADVVKESGFVCACTSVYGANGGNSEMFALKRTEITAFDDTPYKFEKKLYGCYDWLSAVRR